MPVAATAVPASVAATTADDATALPNLFIPITGLPTSVSGRYRPFLDRFRLLDGTSPPTGE
ncbi:hypothetical protein GCM10009639_26020 [Kitasatospora putterlickiae]|uniref:Uncharacterized protein n=1 Tax=Kitasatospora putterlickiae TaxID=221725 RepID=A0ABN1XYM6_9ACTN